MPVFSQNAETFTSGCPGFAAAVPHFAGYFCQEREHIFSRHWLCVGRQNQIREGRRLLRAGRDRRKSDLFTRSKGPGARILQCLPPPRDTTGRKVRQLHETIRCPYHAWTYGLNGRIDRRAAHGRGSMVSIKPGSRCTRSVWRFGGFHLREPRRASAAAGDGVRRSREKFTHWNLPTLRPPGALSMRCGPLEVDLRELLRVLSLSARASNAGETDAVRFSGE